MRGCGEIRGCDRPPVNTCFAVGVVLRVCGVLRFLPEHQSPGVTTRWGLSLLRFDEQPRLAEPRRRCVRRWFTSAEIIVP
jgi:hypothetical protein